MNSYIQELIIEQFNIDKMNLNNNKNIRHNIFNKETWTVYDDIYDKIIKNNRVSVKSNNIVRDKISVIKVKSKKDLKKIIHAYSVEPFWIEPLNWLDVSEVTDMSYIFDNSIYNGDISRWDVSNVSNMHAMFRKSVFNSDISEWNVSSVTDMGDMFHNTSFR